jgi:hypothetical protein
MLFEQNQASPDIIQAYLSYLQEMSRKISLRSGMENVLYRKTKKNYSYYISAESINPRYLKQVKEHIDKETDRKLFLANGLILGTIQKKKIKKYIASPLIYFLVNIDTDESGRQLIHEVEWDSVSLNYDLITLILGKDSIEEEIEIEDHNCPQQINSLSEAEVFENIEVELEKYVNQENIIDIFSDASISREIFIKIKKEVEEFKQALISEEDFDESQLNDFMKNEGLTFFSHRFFYVGSLPGQLSTYTALRKLIQEVK